MGLNHVFTAVEAQLRLVLEDPAINLPVPTFSVGKDKISFQEAPPRIVWVPTRGPVRGPHGQGGDGVGNPRPIKTRHIGVVAHIWAADASKPDGSGDFAAVEVLTNHFVAAIHDVCHGAYDITSEDWPEDIQQQSTRLGMVCLLSMEFQIPFTRELDTYAQILTAPITKQFDPILTG